MTSRFKSLHRTLAFVAERPKKRKRKSDNTCKIHSLIKGFREIPKCCSSSSEEGTKKKLTSSIPAPHATAVPTPLCELQFSEASKVRGRISWCRIMKGKV